MALARPTIGFFEEYSTLILPYLLLYGSRRMHAFKIDVSKIMGVCVSSAI